MRPAWAEIDLKAIRHNFSEVKRLVGNKKIMAVIKADAYGHGALEVGKTCLEEGADHLAVATLKEAIVLRNGGIDGPIMILGWTPVEDYRQALENNIILTIYNLDEAIQLNQEGKNLGKMATIHLKVDTGMTRLGLVPTEENVQIAAKILAMKNIEVEGIFTHLAKADEIDKSYSYWQLERFLRFVEKVEKEANRKIPIKHAANSAAIIDLPESHFDMVRPGIILYGLRPSSEVNLSRIDLRPAMSIKAKVSRIEKFSAGTKVSYGGIYTAPTDTLIASLPLGYADGFSRLLSGKAQVLYGDKRFPVVGRICMDQCMVDVTNEPHIKVGDEFIFMGKGKNDSISPDEIAGKMGTINYEVICMISTRIPRIYINPTTNPL